MKYLISIICMITIICSQEKSTQRVNFNSPMIVLKSKYFFDGVSNEIKTNCVIIVQDNIITHVNPEDSMLQNFINNHQVTELDLGEVTLMPGLIDTHTHLSMDLVHTGMKIIKDFDKQLTRRMLYNTSKTLYSGFTTVRDVASGNYHDINLHLAQEKSLIDGPRIIPVGYGISIPNGHLDQWEMRGAKYGIVDNVEKKDDSQGLKKIREAVKVQIENGAQWIKVAATAGVLSREPSWGEQQFSQVALEVIVDEAQKHEKSVAAHAHGSEGILAAIKSGVSSIEHGSQLTEEIINEMKTRGTYLVPTHYVTIFLNDFFEKRKHIAGFGFFYQKLAIVAKTMQESHRLAIKKKVNIAFGTDAGVFPHGQNAKEFQVLHELGLSKIECLKSATSHAARLLKLKDRGQIAVGKLADIVGVYGNPIENITNMEKVLFVMQDGYVYKATNKHKDKLKNYYIKPLCEMIDK